jgi:nucleotide-binding universal stress UspA family protein
MLNEYGQQLVDGTVAQLKNIVGDDRVNGKVLVGGITSSIVQEVADWKPDLIVMGSHGRKGVQKLFLGSVAEEISKQVTCKIEIIRQTD